MLSLPPPRGPRPRKCLLDQTLRSPTSADGIHANDDLFAGMPVRLVWEQVDPSLSLYRFTPANE